MKDEVVIGGSLEQLNSNYGDADLTLRISGDPSLDLVSGDLPIPTGGEPSLSLEVDGDADLAELVDGEGVPIFGIAPSPYTGEYTVTPTTETQTLATANKTLTRDIVINPIPSNYGLITWNGSTLMVS